MIICIIFYKEHKRGNVIKDKPGWEDSYPRNTVQIISMLQSMKKYKAAINHFISLL